MTRRDIFAMAAAAIQQDNIQQAEKLLTEAASQGKPKASVLCVEDGKQRYVRAFGDATPASKFLIASICKPMTAAGVMWLVDHGKLSLTDPVSKYFPEFADAQRKSMLVSHLLTHTSGLPDMLPENTDLRIKNAPLDEYVRLSLTTPLRFAPGAKWSYSSTGILLASEIAKRIDGRPIAKLLEQEIFSPLGMKDSCFGLGKMQLKDVVRSQTEFAPSDLGASSSAATWDWNSQYWRALGAPWGGGHATASDIAKFLRAFLHPTGKPLKTKTATQMITNQNATGIQPYGLGWSVGARLGKGLSENTFGHGGSTGTLCWADQAKDRIFVLLTSLPAAVANKAIIQPVSQVIAAATAS
jgi:CubicO group peptidase (beta-lactamase class C family)